MNPEWYARKRGTKGLEPSKDSEFGRRDEILTCLNNTKTKKAFGELDRELDRRQAK